MSEPVAPAPSVTARDWAGHEVLQVVSSTHRRGAETFACDLHAALHAQGVDVATVALEAAGDDTSLPLPALSERRSTLGASLRLRRGVAGARVLVAHGSRTLLASHLATRGLDTPYVYRTIGDPAYWVQRPSRRLRVTYLLRRARHVVVYYRAAADTLVRVHGLPPERVVVIGKGVRLSDHPPVTETERSEARGRLGIAENEPVAVYVGALSPEKDPALAVSAALEHPDLRLLVVGDGPERPALARLASAAPDRVRLLGRTDQPRNAMAAADLVLVPSRTEGVPSVAIEAGLCGIPVVATDVGGTAEVVRHGETGLLVPPDDPAAFVAAVPEALRAAGRLGPAARTHCLATFDIRSVAAAWRDLLAR